MKIKSLTKYFIVFLLGTFTATATSSYASNAIEQVKAFISKDIAIVVNGESVKFENPVLNYEGRIYLPIRDFEKFGMGIEWNAESRQAIVDTNIINYEQKETANQNKGDPILNENNETKNNNNTQYPNNCTIVSKYGFDDIMQCDEGDYISPKAIHNAYFDKVTIYFDSTTGFISLKENKVDGKVLLENIPTHYVDVGKSMIEYSYFQSTILPLIMQIEHKDQ